MNARLQPVGLGFNALVTGDRRPATDNGAMPYAAAAESRHRMALILFWVTPAMWTVNYLVARTAPGVVQPHVLALCRWVLAGTILCAMARHELVRLAFPRRVYTQSHFDYLIEALDEIYKNRKTITPYRIKKQAPFLRHFTAHFTPA